MTISSLNDIITTINNLLSLLDRKNIKSENITEGLICLQIAIIETKIFIKNNGYQTNTDLSKLWLSAFDKLKKSGLYNKNEFPEYLYQKARFWGDPLEWLNNPSCMELIPKLKDLDEHCNSILVLLKK